MNPAPPPPGQMLRPVCPRLTRVTLEVIGDHAERLAAAGRIPWDLSEDPAALAAEVEAGRALALAVLVEGRRAGSTFVRVLNRRGSRVLHVLGIEGEFPAGSLSAYFATCEAFGRSLGCAWLECETSRPAMVRLFAEAGCTAAEVRFFKKL